MWDRFIFCQNRSRQWRYFFQDTVDEFYSGKKVLYEFIFYCNTYIDFHLYHIYHIYFTIIQRISPLIITSLIIFNIFKLHLSLIQEQNECVQNVTMKTRKRIKKQKQISPIMFIYIHVHFCGEDYRGEWWKSYDQSLGKWYGRVWTETPQYIHLILGYKLLAGNMINKSNRVGLTV